MSETPVPAPDMTDADRLRMAVWASIGRFFEDGHEIKVLKNGDQIFPAMLDAIKQAKKSIDFVTFVYWTGGIAREFASTLAEKAREGIEVRVILDAFGSSAMRPELVREMTESGVRVERFRPIIRFKFWESDHRTHRKILVVDNEIGFTGGVGIAEEWEGDARNPGEWRETHFEIRGPAVLGLRAVFLNDWRDTGHPIGPGDITVPMPEKPGDVPVAIVDGSAQIGHSEAQRLLEAVVTAAQRSIVIQTPYFNPAKELLDLLIDAVERGVSVDLVVPGPHIDKRISEVMAEEMYEPLAAAGARVWIYQKTMMHSKVIVVDEVLSIVGSINVNRRSTQKDEEVALAILSEEVAAELLDHFQEDVADSEPCTVAQGGRSIRRRIAALLLKPIRNEM